MGFTAIKVVANRARADGSTPAGSLTFTLSEAITNGPVTAAASPTTVPLVAGVASATLYANDDTGTTPTGTTYSVTENVEGAPTRTYPLTVPHAAPAGTVTI